MPLDPTWSYTERRAKSWTFALTSPLYVPPAGYVPKPPRPRPPDLARTATLLEHFKERHVEAEAKPYRAGKRDADLLTGLPREYDTETLCRFVDWFFAREDAEGSFDQWLATKKPTVRLFVELLPRYVVRTAREHGLGTFAPKRPR